MYFVWNLLKQISQKLSGLHFSLFFRQFDVSKLASTVYRNEQIQLSFLCANLCNINVKIANRILFELLFRLFLIILGQFADTIALKKTMQRRTRKVWYLFSQSEETVI
jgi:hypothetical protein